MFEYKERQRWRDRGFIAARNCPGCENDHAPDVFDAYREDNDDMMEFEQYTNADWSEAEYYWCNGWQHATDGEDSA